MQFTMPIYKVVATRVGHTIEFLANVPTHVPKEAWREVQAAGAVPEDQEAVQTARQATNAAIVVDDPVVRRGRIFNAFTAMIERGKRGDFGASGAPHHKVIEDMVGFEVPAQERDALWVEFQQLSAEHDPSVARPTGAPTQAQIDADAAARTAAETQSVAKSRAANTPAADKHASKNKKK